MIEDKTLYSLDDITFVPVIKSNIASRGQVDPLYWGDDIPRMPIFISPMSCLINEKNFDKIDKLGFNVIMPRSVAWNIRMDYMKKGKWIAVGHKEAEKLYYEFEAELILNQKLEYLPHICIDQAQGHSYKLLSLCRKFKTLLKNDIVLMTGNIANPEAYEVYDNIGIDYVRVGIGGGSGCTTSVQTGMHYPMASLIDECNTIRKNRKLYNTEYKKFHTKIIADGGITTIDKIIKAIGLGADYVMIGSFFTRTGEACSKFTDGFCGPDTFEYYGMSTKRAQREIYESSGVKDKLGEFTPKHDEGLAKLIKKDYSIDELIFDYKHAMKSAMSYNNSDKLSDFVGNTHAKIISPKALQSYMK